MVKLFKSLPFRLLIALIVGLIIGWLANEPVINVIQSIRHITGQIIFFSVPLIVLGFVAPSIAKMGRNGSRLLGFSLIVVFLSVIGAAALSMVSGYIALPLLNIAETAEARRALPEMLFQLNIPPIMPTMSAMALALMLGLAVAWTKSATFGKLLDEFHEIVLQLVKKIVLPIMPVFIATVFAPMAYDGRLTGQLPVFITVVLIIIVVQLLWVAILYVAAFLYTGKNPFEVIRHYGTPYLTAAGTMSSAATLAVALEGANKSKVLNKDMVAFGLPLYAHIHMPGSIVTLIFLSMTVSQVFDGALPVLSVMILYAILQVIFVIAAPGVPGGTIVASLGLIVAVLGFTDTQTGLMLTIFALTDSFGTATNICSDGPLAMILTKYAEKRGLAKVPNVSEPVNGSNGDN